jgi:hypothetical protein
LGADSYNTWDGSGDDYIDGEGIGMKPIEAGCLALVLSRAVPVHEVRVNFRMIGYINDCESCGEEDKWWDVTSRFYNSKTAACTCCLRRIDGHDPDAITETEKENDKCVYPLS